MLLFGLGLLILLTALLVYPIAWLVRQFRRRSTVDGVDALPQTGLPGVQGTPETMSVPRTTTYSAVRTGSPPAWRLAPWLAVLSGVLLTGFIVVVVTILVGMYNQNDLRILVGLPGSARPLFLIPLVVILFVIAMLLIALLSWARRWGAVWGRLYFSLLSLSAVLCLVILGVWGMLTAFITG